MPRIKQNSHNAPAILLTHISLCDGNTFDETRLRSRRETYKHIFSIFLTASTNPSAFRNILPIEIHRERRLAVQKTQQTNAEVAITGRIFKRRGTRSHSRLTLRESVPENTDHTDLVDFMKRQTLGRTRGFTYEIGLHRLSDQQHCECI